MGLIRDEIFVCVDCESTGLETETDRIVEIAAAQFTFAEVLDQYESLIDPERPIPKVSQDIHNISSTMVEGKPKIAEALPAVLKLLEGKIIVGHGIPFDIALIAAEAKRAQIPTNIQNTRFIDTLRLARLYGESPINSLDRLRQHFNLEAQGSHRAMSDVLVNIEVFKHLVKTFKTTEEIFRALEKPIKLRAMPLGKHKGRRFEEIPVEYLLWAERKDFDQDLLFSIRTELRQRKKGGGFEQAANPFGTL
jgi:DNA polymerase-3 subunit epsilon